MLADEKCLITDFDNTLFDWFDNWYEAFNGALCYIFEQCPNLDKKEFLLDIKNIHVEHNTTEYLNVFYEISELQKYKTILNFHEVCSYATVLREELKAKHLHLFCNVLETFKYLKQNYYKIVLFTESEAYSTSLRIKALKLDGIVDYIYAPPAKNFGNTDLVYTKLISFDKQSHYKPNKKNLEKILNDLHLKHENCYYIGDSLIKDIKMAQNANIKDIYAKYGENYKKRPEYELLKNVTFWKDSLVKAEEKSNERDIKPTFILKNSFKEILKVLNINEDNNV